MSKILKISAIIILLVMLLIGVFHSAIIKYALQKAVAKSSKGNISLSIEDFSFDIIDGDISITFPVLIFDDLFIDAAKKFKVEEVAFKEIRIEKLELMSLVFRQEINAGRFLIDKPEFIFTEHGARARSNYQPKGFFDALKQNDESFSDFKIKIADIEIHYGTVTFSARSGINIDPGQVDFTINLENFSTHHDSAEMNRLLYSDSFRFKLLNVHKVLSSGYELNIDSVNFSSVHRDLIVTGLSMEPPDTLKDENTISLRSNRISFNDISLDDLRELKDLNLSSVELLKTELISHVNTEKKKEKSSGESLNTAKLLSELHSLSIDTFSIEEFNYFSVKNNKDTTVKADDVNLQMTGLLLDSSMYSDIAGKIGFEDISLNTGAVDMDNVLPGLKVNYAELSYSNVDDEFDMYGLKVKSNNAENLVDLSVPELNVNGLSVHGLQRMNSQKISVFVNDPSGYVLLKNHPVTDTLDQNIPLPFGIFLYQFIINNGNISVRKDSVFTLKVDSLNFEAGGVRLPEKPGDSLLFKSLDFSTGAIALEEFTEPLSVSLSGVKYGNSDLVLKDLMMTHVVDTVTNETGSALVELRGVDRDMLMCEKKLSIDTLLFVDPSFSGVLDMRRPMPEERNENGRLAPLFMNVGKVIVREGEISAMIKTDYDNASVCTKYDIVAGPFFVDKDDSLKNMTSNADWVIDIDSLTADVKKHHVSLKRLKSSSADSLFEISGLYIHPVDSFDVGSEQKVMIKMLDLPSMRISGLDYGKLMKMDTLQFRRLSIKSPDISISVVKDKKPGRSGPVKVMFPVLIYDEAGIKNLSLELSRSGAGVNKTVDLKGVSFVHFKDKSGTGNVLKDMLFSVDKIRMYDSISHSTVDIHGIQGDTLNEVVSVKSISTGKYLNDKTEQAGTKLYLNDISFHDVNIGDSLPLNIRSSKLKVKDVDVLITGDTIKKQDRKIFALRLKGLKNYRSVFSSLVVDTADLSDINFRTHTIGNLPEQIGKLDSITLVIEGIKIDSSMAEKSNPDIIDKIHVDLNGKTNITADSLYEMGSGILHYSFLSQKIIVDSFYIAPLFKSDEFFERAKYQTDRIDLFVRKIIVDDVGFDDFLEDNILDLSRIDLLDLKAEIYRNKHYPIKPGVVKILPQDALMEMKRAFRIDSVRVINSYLLYRELGEKSLDPGEVFFDRVNINAYNITNSFADEENSDLDVNFESRIMGKAGMVMNVKFPLKDDSVDFILTGKTEKMDLKLLNPLTTNLLGIGIIKGKGRVDVNRITGTDDISSGKLIFRYKKLRIHPYSRKKEKLKKGPLSPLIKFMINDLVVKSNNPKFARKPRVGQVYFERDYRKGVINYIWKSVLSGLMSTMGFNNKEQRKEKKENKAALKQSAALLNKE